MWIYLEYIHRAPIIIKKVHAGLAGKCKPVGKLPAKPARAGLFCLWQFLKLV